MKHSRIGAFLTSLLLLGILSCGGSDGGTTPSDPPRATSVRISQTSVTLSFVGETATLNARVVDQNGQTFAGTITWASDNPTVATISTAGLLTARENGASTITASSGTLSATLTITVQQATTRIVIVSGDGQTATVGEALADPLVVRADDAGGTLVAGTSLAFVVSSGGGQVGSPTVTTDAQGVASTTWTLGTIKGLQQVGVSAAGTTSLPTQISATGLAAAPTAFLKSSGDLQTSPTGLPAPQAIVVQLQDEFGNGVIGTDVTFLVTLGGGSVDPAVATTDEDGNAQTTWTMGSTVGPAGLTATAAGFPPVAFTGVAILPTPDLVAGALSISPDNPTSIEMVTVTLLITNIGSSTTGTTFPVQLLVDGVDAALQASGPAASSATLMIGPLLPLQTVNAEFTVGPLAPGTRAFSVVIDPDGAISETNESNNTSQQTVAVVAETELLAGVPIANVGGTCTPPSGAPDCRDSGGDELLFGFNLTEANTSIEFTLRGGVNDADMYVQFEDRPVSRDDYECISGAADSNETCRFNGAPPGMYHVLIHAFETFSGTTMMVTTGLPVLPYDIELVFLNSGTTAQNAAFTSAGARWGDMITEGSFGTVDFESNPIEPDSCVTGQPFFDGVVNKLRIYANIIEIDGPGDVLGRAGPCLTLIRSGLPVVGFMEFDSEDLDALEANGRLTSVILHEMGHVLGIGVLWRSTGLLRNPSSGNSSIDTHFTGPLTISAFDDAGGTAYTGGEKVPVANTGGEGSFDSHWRESILTTELMTPALNAGSNRLSAISVQSLADVGYRVDASQADPFTLSLSAVAPLTPGPIIDLRGDTRPGPIPEIEVDKAGRVVRVIRN